jgi:1-acyl-sn-glycerol-3-phosphate acyltransferase
VSWNPKSPTPPRGYAYGGAYRITVPLGVRACLYILLGRSRSLARDAALALRGMPSPPLVRGLDNIPESGRLVIVANHYERTGMWMAWPALLISNVLWQRTGQDIRWIAIQEWESFTLCGIPIPRNWIRRVFERAFSVYGILAMGPDGASHAARAHSMRAAIGALRHGDTLGLMPEGTVGETPELLAARDGAGAFLLLLVSAGAHIIPAGIYEEEGRMVVSFGSSVDLTPPCTVLKADRDLWARNTAMAAIKDLLPEPLWGVYRDRASE